MIYKVKRGARLPVSAQVAGEECARLESQGRLTPRNLVEESRPEDAPLHRYFEWDDSVAAEKWRCTQAAYIIRSVEVTIERTSEPTRAFIATISDGTHTYRDVGVVLRDADSRAELLRDAMRELLAFKRKYQNLRELVDVIDAIDGALGSQGRLELTA